METNQHLTSHAMRLNLISAKVGGMQKRQH